MNLIVLRGARPHPARRRRDDRVHRPARRRRRALAPAARPGLGRAGRSRASCCSPTPSAAAASTRSAWPSRWSPPPAGRPTSSLAQRAGRALPRRRGARAGRCVVAALVPLVPGLAEGGTDLLTPEILALGPRASPCCQLRHPLLAGDRGAAAHARARLRRAHEPRAGVAAIAGFVVLGQDLGAARARRDRARRRRERSARRAGRTAVPRLSAMGAYGILRACSRSTRPTS